MDRTHLAVEVDLPALPRQSDVRRLNKNKNITLCVASNLSTHFNHCMINNVGAWYTLFIFGLSRVCETRRSIGGIDYEGNPIYYFSLFNYDLA